MNKDLSVMIDDIKLNIRVGAIIKYQNKILVEKNKNVDFYVVPGGRLKSLEDSQTALIRELKEELGIDFKQEEFKLKSFIENFFTFDNHKYHELYFLYEVTLQNEYNLQDGMQNLDNIDTNYYLFSFEEFKQHKILPEKLKEIIENNEFKKYIVNDLKSS